MTLGARPAPGGCGFRVWAPRARRVEVVFPEIGGSAALDVRERGYHEGFVEGVAPGALYQFRLDGGPPRADPASRHQPHGVHGPSRVVTPDHPWSDAGWKGPPLSDYAIYEMHVGTFTHEGTFAAAAARLPELVSLGVTAVEMMPVAQFPGARNWGYDGVLPYAVQDSYGGPEELRRFVDACHSAGLAAVLDVVYNHFGPEGNYLHEFGPYLTSRYETPWGDAVNLDGAESDEVRRYFVENALEWVTEYHFDALRLDAVHAIVDNSAYPFLEELAAAVHDRARELGRLVHVIGEDDRNDARLVRGRERGGFGFDAQWSDDFHHALHALLTGESRAYYADFGRASHLGRAYEHGFAYTGQYSAYRKRRQGRPPEPVPPERFVVCAQNHDQVGNRAHGERFGTLLDFERRKLAAGVVLLSPFTPLLFMGEEYGETAPFLYFVSHGDPALADAVRRGRQEEFAELHAEREPPDPVSEETFARSRLDRSLREREPHATLLAFTRELLALRRRRPAREAAAESRDDAGLLAVRRRHDDGGTWALYNFSGRVASFGPLLPRRRWRRTLASSDGRWAGPGAPEDPLSVAPTSFSLLEEVQG